MVTDRGKKDDHEQDRDVMSKIEMSKAVFKHVTSLESMCSAIARTFFCRVSVRVPITGIPATFARPLRIALISNPRFRASSGGIRSPILARKASFRPR